MNIYTRFIIGLLSLAAIGFLEFRPIAQPLNTIVLIALGFNTGWQVLKLYGRHA